MKDNQQQLDRISMMEQHLRTATTAVNRVHAAIDQLRAAREAVAALNEYYGSDVWKQDLADDEAGLLPADLKRGVLSEDAIWNLLTDWHDLTSRLDLE